MAPTKSKFDAFERKDLVYSTVGEHEILTSVFTPKSAIEQNAGYPLSKRPVVVFWHGGGFIVGDRLYEPWWPDWLLEFVQNQDAIVVAPDYRLLPEATGADVMDDMMAFWAWLRRDLPDVAVAENWSLRPDLDHVICVGHSAGGVLALNSALENQEVNVKAVVSLYGPLYSNVPELKMSRPRQVLGSWPPPPRQAESTIRSYLRRNKGCVRTQGDVMEMWGLVACILQQGWLPRMVTQKPDRRLDSLATIEEKKNLPPIWMIHGLSDSVVPATCSTEFLKRADALVPEVPKVLSIQPGEHNFDASLTMQEPWIADGCEFLLQHW